MSPPAEGPAPAVWVTVIDPETPDGRQAITASDQATPFSWSVPAKAAAEDLVFGWVTGGTGFAYLYRIAQPPTPAAEGESGPRQASLAVLERIQPSVPMPRLKADPTLRSWWLVRYSMQGVVRAQQESLTQNPEWDGFARLLDGAAPMAARALRAHLVAGPGEGEGAAAPEAETVDTVSLLDEGSTEPESLAVTHALGDVLARASAINEKRSSFDLSFSSLLLALLYGDDPLGQWLAEYFARQGVRVEHSLGKVRKDAGAAREAARRGMAERQSILAAPLSRTVSARQALAEASRIAQAQGAPHVDAPHLVAAVIALSDYHEEDFGALALDRPRWGAAFVQQMMRRARDAADGEFWRRFYSRRFPGHALPPPDPVGRAGHRPDYDPDAYTSRDLLSIDDEVSALAYVIAATQTQPPLSIGLFGDWGSGKTFFMKHLRKRIDALCAGAREQKPSERVCHAQIAQIEFNAWHYQEGDLWASLVDHILRNLRFGEDEDEARLGERRDQVVRQLDATEIREEAAAERAAKVDERVAQAERNVADLQQKEQDRRDELSRKVTPETVAAAVRTGAALDPQLQERARVVARKLRLPALGRDAASLQDALREVYAELTGFWKFLAPLVRAEDRARRVLLLAAAVGVPALLAVVLHAVLLEQGLLERLTGAAVTLGTFLAGATKWLRQQAEWLRDVRGQVEPVVRDVDHAVAQAIEAQLTAEKAAVAAKTAELEGLRREQAEARQAKAETAAQADALRQKLSVLGEDGLMRAFLDDRIGGGVYAQKLGVAALVRRDFERLSRKIAEVTEREGQGGLKAGELVINRIVLYIDDLDRCEMDKVVPVLRAVHLLLAFPAFVVVVGVDSRWVARCLESDLPAIFADDADDARPGVTPLDYLEKIFQIPIWLEPVPPERRVFMVRELLRKPLPTAAAARPPGAAGEEGATREAAEVATPGAASAHVGSTPPAASAAPAPAPGPPSARAATPAPAAARTHPTPALELNPRGLEVTDGEFGFLDQIGGLLSASPRAIKRFVNTYRLLNVSLAQQANARDGERRPRDYEVRMMLLAVLVGMPDLSRWLQAALRDPDAGNLALTSLVDVMEDSRQRDIPAVVGESGWPRALAQWDAVRQWIDERGEAWRAMPAARVAQWIAPVGRYTFNLTRSTTAGFTAPPLGVGGPPVRPNGGERQKPLPPPAAPPPGH